MGALRALVDTPLFLAGDGAAGAGLLGASGLGLLGDALSVLDANRVTEPVLAGRLHRAVEHLGWSLSALGTGGFEVLRVVDVERWPEPRAAYLEAAPGAGRLDTALGGISALALAPRDLVSGATRTVLLAVGARALAERIERAQDEARVLRVGPSPADAAHKAEP